MINAIHNFFKLDEHKTDIKTEFIAGLTTFITMAYIIAVNPAILSLTGMDKGAVFTATIVSAVIATLIMGIYANVPFAQAPGMGLNAFFTFTVCFALKFSWQQALAIVFICGIINFIIVITNVRKMLILAIPQSVQYAIGAGIGLFIAFIGFRNAGFLGYTPAPDNIPFLTNFKDLANPSIVLLGLVVTIVLMLFRVKGSILIGIVVATIISIFMGLASMPAFEAKSFLPPSLAPTFFQLDFAGLFTNPDRLFTVLSLVFAFSLTDTFDTIGTFIGTGKKSGVFEEKGNSHKMDRALVSDGVATSIGAVLGTSNVTSYVESAAGISAGGRTGLTSVFTAIFFLLSLFIFPFVSLIPPFATASALIVVGLLMVENVAKIDWVDLEVAAPAFFTVIVMPFTYSISNGIAAGLIFYAVIKIVKGKTKEVHPLLYIVSGLFLLNFIINAI